MFAGPDPWRGHAARILSIGLPLMGSQMAQIAIQVTDTLMLGRYDVDDLAAQVLASSLFNTLLLMGSGFGWAVMPIVAAAESGGTSTEIRRVTRMALWLSTLFAALALPVFLFAGPLLTRLGQAPETTALAARYLAIQGWSILPALWIMVLRSYLAGLDLTRAVLGATLLSVVVNAALNWALIFGTGPAPELGITGAAIASLVSTAAGLAALALYAARRTPEHRIFARLWIADGGAFGRVFRLGWPIGLTTLAEVALFTAASLLMGRLGTVPLAAHGIAMQIISVIFMLHIGLSQAATIRAGAALGRRDGPGLRQGALTALALSGAIAVLTVIAFLALPGTLFRLFLDADDPARDQVIALGRGLLVAAAIFQIADAAQVMALGLLRGVQDTRTPMILAAISYWIIGIPLAALMGLGLDIGGVGVWLGMATGLSVAGLLMQRRFWTRGAYAVENGVIG